MHKSEVAKLAERGLSRDAMLLRFARTVDFVVNLVRLFHATRNGEFILSDPALIVESHFNQSEKQRDAVQGDAEDPYGKKPE